jgi:hypothetical protein
MVGVSLGIALTDATVTMAGNLTATGDATFRATTDQTLDVVCDTTGLKGIAGSVAIGVIVSNANAIVTDDAVLTIGDDLYVQADTSDAVRVMARSTAGKDGSVAVAIAFTYEDGETNAFLDGTATVGGDIEVNALMVQNSVDVKKLFVIPSTSIGTSASAGVGDDSKGDYLDDAKSGVISKITDPIKKWATKKWYEFKNKQPDDSKSTEPSYDVAAGLAIAVDTNTTTARIGDGNTDLDNKNGEVQAAAP